MQYLIDTDKALVYRSPQEFVLPTIVDDKPLVELINTLKYNVPIDTGLIPLAGTGLLSYKQAGGYSQFVFQHAPTKKLLKWGEYESDSTAAIYEVAMPWYINVIDFHNGYLLGARHFYSPEAIYSFDQPLYVVNVPNTNTTGYRGNSVGWICLYHTQSEPIFNVGEALEYALTRVNGLSEPYNNANMSSTDGTRFYQKRDMPSYMYDPHQWVAKTKAEGIDWICDPANLIMMKTAAYSEKDGIPTHHNTTYNKDGEPYTLYRACNEAYSAYYDDTLYIKPHMPGYKISYESFFATQSIIEKPKPIDWLDKIKDLPNHVFDDLKYVLAGQKLCPGCEQLFPANHDFVDVVVSYGGFTDSLPEHMATESWCESCVQEWAFAFKSLNAMVSLDLLVSALNVAKTEVLCFPEETISCALCGTTYTKGAWDDAVVNHYTPTGQKFPIGCVACKQGEYVKTASHGHVLASDCITLEQLHIVHVDGKTRLETAPIYYPIFTNHIQCKCGLILDSHQQITAGLDADNRCKSCVNIKQEFTPLFSLPSTAGNK